MIPGALFALLVRVAPGLLLGLLTLITMPRQRVELRLAIYVLLFVLVRDAMTPMGLWQLSAGGSVRMTNDPVILIDMGLVCFASVFVINAFEPELARILVWFRNKPHWDLLAGIAGALIIVLPVALIRRTLLPEVPLPPVPGMTLGPLLALCLLGNFLEEALFRGYFQGLVERASGPLRAAFASGLFFAFCHVFLAITVTNIGVVLLAFVWFEGTIAGLIRARFGLVASTLTHGGAVFALASGLAAG